MLKFKKREQEIYEYLKKSTFEEMAKIFSEKPLINTQSYDDNYILEYNVNNEPFKVCKKVNQSQNTQQHKNYSSETRSIYGDESSIADNLGYMTPGGWVGYDGGSLLTQSDGFSGYTSNYYDHV